MQAKTFKNVLSANRNKEIRLYLKNNQFVDGILLDVKKDHIILKVNRNIIYFAIHQIQTLSKNAKDHHVAVETSPHLNRNDLMDVLIALRYHWVTVNDFGNLVLSGVLSSIFEDHIILINNKELLYIPKFNITNISSDISKNDLTFLNKIEQINIQKLYKINISKGLKAVENSSPIYQQESGIPDTGILFNDEFEEAENLEEIEENVSKSSPEKAVIEAITLMASQLGETRYMEELEQSISISSKEEVVLEDTIQVNDEFEEATFIGELDNSASKSSPLLEDELKNVLENESSIAASDGLVELDLKQVEIQNIEENDEDNVFVELKEKESHRDNNLREDEPVSYSMQKIIPLTAWSAMNIDQSTIAIPKNTKTQSETSVQNPITVKQSSELINPKAVINHTIGEENSEEKLALLDDKPKPDEKKKPSIVVNAISKKERNKMLENQYYALMNYATKQITNSVKYEHEGGKSYFHPSYNLELNENRASVKSFGTSETNSSSPREEKDALEKQFISLMRHATKMYRELGEY